MIPYDTIRYKAIPCMCVCVCVCVCVLSVHRDGVTSQYPVPLHPQFDPSTDS